MSNQTYKVKGSVSYITAVIVMWTVSSFLLHTMMDFLAQLGKRDEHSGVEHKGIISSLALMTKTPGEGITCTSLDFLNFWRL